MPSQRRIRVFFVVVLAIVITTLFYTSNLRQTREPDTRTLDDFFHKTVSAIDKARGGQPVNVAVKDKNENGVVDQEDERMAKEMADRLKAAEQKAKDAANAKAPHKPDAPGELVGVGSSASGQQKKVGDIGESKPKTQENENDVAIQMELDGILKKSPMIIFSKSYCPYSKRAKGILLEKYVIKPAPFVVELDLHPTGPQLQALLASLTGRKTVPNIMINGKSIGGSDEIVALDNDDALASKIKDLGGTKVEVAQERFSETEKAAQAPV